MKLNSLRLNSIFLILVMLFSVMPAISHAAAEEIDFSSYIVDKHPKLYVTSFDGLKEKYLSDSLTAKWYDDLIKEATVISDGGVMCAADGTKLYDIDKLTASGAKRRVISSQAVLARFYCLAFAAACEDSKALADRLWLEIEDAINLPNWNTRHWLEPAEMMHSVSIAYDWCYKFWTDEQKQLMETKVYELGASQAVREYNGVPRWYRWHYGFKGTEVGTNWTIVCNTGVLLTSLVFYDTNPTFYNTKINNAVRSMKAGLNAYSEDGSYRENINYWNYATRNLIMATDAFECAIGGDFNVLPPIEEPFFYDFTKAPGISVTPDFPIYANGPAGVFNYGDASGGSISSSPAFMWIGNRFQSPHYTKYHLDNIAQKGHSGINVPLDLLWYEGGEMDKIMPPDRLFGDDFVSLRSSWDNEDSLWIAMKGGPNGKPHNHYDLGTFALDYGGVRFARQLGAVDYDAEEGRGQYYKGRTEGQNTVLINPDETVGQNTSGTSEFTHFYSGNTSAYAILDMTGAYDKAVKSSGTVDTAVTSARRGVKMYSDRTRVVIQDEVKMSTPSELYWFMHTAAKITLYNNNKSAVLTSNGKSLYFNLVSDCDANFEIMTASPLPTSPSPADQPKSSGTKLAIHAGDVTEATIAVEVVASGGIEPVYSGYIVPLDEWHPENDVIRFDRKLIIYGDDKPGRTATMVVRSPLGYVYGIDQGKADERGEYVFDCTLPENYENGIYSVYLNGELYKTFEVSDGTDVYIPSASYTISYELPDGVKSSVLVAAEYKNGNIVQLTSAEYDSAASSATVTFDFSPSKGSKLKFFYLENLNSLRPLYQPLIMDVD